ncbi:MAG: lysozyme inhibitor LprI family protein [Hyphomicrobiales bacterium]
MSLKHLIVASMAIFLFFPAHANNHLDRFEDPLLGLTQGLEGCMQTATARNQSKYSCIGYSSDSCIARPENQNTAGMEICNLDEMRAWDSLLNTYYQILSENGSFPGLRDIQRAWISYRDLKCDLFDALYEGGSLARVLRADCMRQETARRVLDMYPLVVGNDAR